MTISFDSNILLYSIDPDAPAKRILAGELLTRAVGSNAVLTAQALGEFLNIVRRKRLVDFDEALRIASGWATMFPLIPTEPLQILRGGALAQRHRLQFWDAVLLATASANGITALLTEDMQDGATIDGVLILDPFVPANRARLDALLPA